MARWLHRLNGLGRRAVLGLALLAACTLATAAGAPLLKPDVRVADMHDLGGIAQYWIDPSGTLGIDQIEARGDTLPWQPTVRGQRFDIDGKALWMRFDVDLHADAWLWFVELQDSSIDRVVMYYRGLDGQWVAREAGDAQPVARWNVPGRLPTFTLSPQTDAPVHYWLRIEHARLPFASPIHLVEGRRMAADRDLEQFLLGGYFGLVLLVLFLATWLALSWRDRTLAVYAGYVLAVGVAQLAQLGIGAQYLWDGFPAWNRLSTFVAPALAAAAGLWFVRTLTEPARSSPWLDRVVLAGIAIHVTVVLADTVLPLQRSYRHVSAMVAVLFVLMLVCLVIGWRRRDAHLRLAILGFVPMIAMAMLPLARGLGLLPAMEFTRYALTVGGALEMPILLYAISLRASAAREARVRARASATTDALTGLAHQRVLLLRLDGALKRARRQGTQFALIGVHGLNWRDIVRKHGPQAGEQALVQTAARLRTALRDGDVAARVGEADFAVLLDGHTARQQAVDLARQVQAQGEQSAAQLAKGEGLDLRVSVAMLPQNTHDPAVVLRWVLDAARAPDGMGERGEVRVGPVRMLS